MSFELTDGHKFFNPEAEYTQEERATGQRRWLDICRTSQPLPKVYSEAEYTNVGKDEIEGQFTDAKMLHHTISESCGIYIDKLDHCTMKNLSEIMENKCD